MKSNLRTNLLADHGEKYNEGVELLTPSQNMARGYRKPFLKWAGGKTQLVSEILSNAPKNYNKYIEPFIGGGAVFFALDAPKAIISDSNEDLILTYREIKLNPSKVISYLDTYENTEEFFYTIRGLNTETLSSSERAARLIYLNKTCFNGLYRVNKKGEFNVPYGKRSNVFFNEESLLDSSKYLKETQIIHSDYKSVLKKFATKGDFIFLDPPYQPVGKFSDFKRYTKEFFYEQDQIELAGIFKSLVEKGCNVMLTNSDHPLILDLYKEFKIKIFETKRLISSNANTRTGTDILVIGGYS